MVSSEEQAELFVSERVFHGTGFNLDCHVENIPTAVNWYIATSSENYEIIYYVNTFLDDEGIKDNTHLEERDVNATQLSDSIYRLHINDADRDEDTASYKCEREQTTMSDSKYIYVNSK